jgi:hypothetical protein
MASFTKELKKITKKVKRFLSGERTIYTQRMGDLKVAKTDDYALVSYEKDGAFDYEAYKKIQEAGNRRKLNNIFVQEELIARIAQRIRPQGGIQRILCHGTRNGAEQKLFKKYFGGVEVLGTEIAETATQFEDTIQWDFHEARPEWLGRWDLIYSNSWDHSYDPVKLFKTWESCLRPGGWMVVEHTRVHEADKVNTLDPFGISFEGLLSFMDRNTSLGFEAEITMNDDLNRRAAVFRNSL